MSAAARPSQAGGFIMAATGAVLFSAKAVIVKLAYRHGVDPITLIASQPTVLAAHPSLPAHSVQDLIKLARQKPGQRPGAEGIILHFIFRWLVFTSSGSSDLTYFEAFSRSELIIERYLSFLSFRILSFFSEVFNTLSASFLKVISFVTPTT